MAVYTTTTKVNALLPDDYGPLVVQPALDASVFARIATTVTTPSTEYRIPIVAADPTASWVAEGAEITRRPDAAGVDGHPAEGRRADVHQPRIG
jgi:HK97 family phage major capsid protein